MIKIEIPINGNKKIIAIHRGYSDIINKNIYELENRDEIHLLRETCGYTLYKNGLFTIDMVYPVIESEYIFDLFDKFMKDGNLLNVRAETAIIFSKITASRLKKYRFFLTEKYIFSMIEKRLYDLKEKSEEIRLVTINDLPF